jgi:hypothetical protein
MMVDHALRRVSKLERRPKRAFRIFHAGAIGFVNDKHVRDFQNSRLDSLDVIAEAGRLNHNRGMRELSNIHFALACTDGFNNDDIVAGSIKDLCKGSGRLSESAHRAARGHGTDEHTLIAGKIAHAYAVS